MNRKVNSIIEITNDRFKSKGDKKSFKEFEKLLYEASRNNKKSKDLSGELEINLLFMNKDRQELPEIEEELLENLLSYDKYVQKIEKDGTIFKNDRRDIKNIHKYMDLKSKELKLNIEVFFNKETSNFSGSVRKNYIKYCYRIIDVCLDILES